MKVEVFTLCDAATDQRGKLNILGTFDLICSSKAPIQHPACTIALRVRFSKLEEGSHNIRLSFCDADGQAIIPPMGGDFKVQMGPNALSHARNLIFNFQALKFKEFGDYSINLHIDKTLIDSLPLYIRKMENRPPSFKGFNSPA